MTHTLLAEYWNKRFEDGSIWGEEPCPSAFTARDNFVKAKVQNVLVPGCGYGRNSLFFAKTGFDVTAFDISEVAIEHAIELAKKSGQANIIYNIGDISNLEKSSRKFNGIYLCNVIHLFKEQERDQLFQTLTDCLEDNGILVFTCISPTDYKNYGVGKEIEPNTFEHDGKVLYFFTEEKIYNLLSKEYKIMSCRLHTQVENDPKGNTEELQLWEVVAQKNCQ
jgi:SAM-dependent methyltransferase